MTWPTTRPLALIEPDAQLLARIPIGEADELQGDDARLLSRHPATVEGVGNHSMRRRTA